MWYNTIPVVSLSSWLQDMMDLFNSTLAAVLGSPVFGLFAVLLLFLALVSLLSSLVQNGRKGRL